MTSRGAFMWLAVLAIGLGAAPPANAHQVDEYLQATRISIGTDRVDLEIDLTPGTKVASDVWGWMDTNRDGLVSQAEGEAYAREVLRSVALSADGRSVPVRLVTTHVPALSDMRLGAGTIQVRATATVARAWFGHHQIAYSNAHRSDSSVYLVNALVPEDSRIQIAGQRRDRAQHGLSLEYTVAADVRWASLLVIGLAMVGALGVSRLPRPSTPS